MFSITVSAMHEPGWVLEEEKEVDEEVPGFTKEIKVLFYLDKQ